MDIPENSINKILENNPSQGTLHVLLTIMNEKGSHRLVIKECLKAISRFPEDLTLKKILADAYLAEGRINEAEAEFDRVIDGMKALAGAYRSRAGIYVHRRREEDAADSLKKYLVFSPEDEEAAILLEELLATSAVTSIELAEEQIDADIPETEEPADIEAIEFQEPVDAEITESQESFDTELEIMESQVPDEVDIMEVQDTDDFPEIITASLAETYFEQDQLDEAKEIYEKLVERDPENASLKSRLDEISLMMEKKDEPEEVRPENSVRRKKERIISLLDTWRVNIKDLAGEGLSE